MQKKCFFCGSKKTVKDGFSNGQQRYRCRDCGRRFTDNHRIDECKLYAEYLDGKQTLTQLAVRHRVSISTIQRKLYKSRAPSLKTEPQKVVILMDTTYWGHDFGVVAIKDAHRKNVLWRKFIYRNERIADYLEGVKYLEDNELEIIGIVCDGLRGLIKSLGRYPVQYCQFHQVKYVRLKLTKHPESEAGKELLDLCRFMFHTDKESFKGAFELWREKHNDYLSERSTPDEKGRTHYLHKRLRSAFLSVQRNMDSLWVWYDHKELNIPNTNNGIEALFTDLKTKLRVHNGLSKKNREQFIDEYFAKTPNTL